MSPRARPPAAVLSHFFRTLQMMYGAGIPLQRGLDCLTRQAAEGLWREALSLVGARVHGGWPLWRACHESRAFTPAQVQLMRLGETTGSLARVLDGLATYEERRCVLQAQVGSALVYPAFLLTLCGLMVLVLPGILFQPLLAFLAQSGQPLPWTTQVLLGILRLSRHPTLVAGLALAAVGLARALGRRWSWTTWEGRLREVPAAGRIWQLLTAARFARALEAVVLSGGELLGGLQLAAACSGSPRLVAQISQATQQIREGEDVVAALQGVTALPPILGHTLMTGRETGCLDRVLEGTARLMEEELSLALERATSLLEPMVMLGAGVLVGLVAHATLGPMLAVLRGLSL